MKTHRPAPRPRATTITDVAREARVSVASVSRVVNGHENVTPETRKRILDAVERLRYVPHTAARSLITRKSQAIGVLLPDLHGEFFSELIRGIDEAAREHRIHLLVSSSHGDATEMAEAIRAMRGRVEGLLVLAPHLDTAGLGEIDAAVPTVFINSRISDGVSSALSIDGYGGARAMVRHLVSHGHRAIAHLTGPTDNYDAHERERGYRDELAASLPSSRPILVRGNFSEASGYAGGRELAARAPRPDAAFAANDAMAIGCLAAFAELGVAPRDIALTGFDDIPLAAYVRPALTTMRVPIVELGRRAFVQLAAAIAQPGTVRAGTTWLATELIVRESCGAAGPRALSLASPTSPSSSAAPGGPHAKPRKRR
jgi:LacI family transcriptional regulator